MFSLLSSRQLSFHETLLHCFVVKCNLRHFFGVLMKQSLMPSRRLLPTLTVLVYLAFALFAGMAQNARPSQDDPLPADPAEFVRTTVNNELNALDNDHSRWMYRLHREDDKGTQDRQVIETTEGNLSKTVLFNGQPLTEELRQKDAQRMLEQVTNPDARERREKREKADAEKVRQLLKGIPDAFLFAYDATEDGLVRVAFVPNPKYSPPTREMTVYHSMKGRMWIDRPAMRLARIEGQLFEDVNFGWGLLGHLDKGGTFKVIQKDVEHGHWESVLVDLNIHGRAVIFKTIAVHQRQVFTDFRRVPDNTTLNQALEMLQHADSAIAAEPPKGTSAPTDKRAEAKPRR